MSAIGFAALILLSACEIGQQDKVTAEMPEVILELAADTLFINAKILIVDESFSIASELAVRDDRIVAVGRKAVGQPFIDNNTKIIDLQGKTMIPDLIDNHIHFIRAGQLWNLQARIDGLNKRQ